MCHKSFDKAVVCSAVVKCKYLLKYFDKPVPEGLGIMWKMNQHACIIDWLGQVRYEFSPGQHIYRYLMYQK